MALSLTHSAWAPNPFAAGLSICCRERIETSCCCIAGPAARTSAAAG